MTTQDELPVRSLPPSDKPLPQLGPHQPAPAGPFPGPHGKPGGKYQEDGTKEKGKIYSSPNETVPSPSAEVTTQENKNVLPNSRIAKDSSQALPLKIPLRTNYGKSGTDTLLYTNYFQIFPSSSIILWKYNIGMSPRNGPKKDISKRQRYRLLGLLIRQEFLNSHGRAVATDYNSILITKKALANLDGDSILVSIKYWDVEEHGPGPNAPEYDMRISLACTIDLKDFNAYFNSATNDQALGFSKADAITALNIIMTRSPQADPEIFTFGGNRFYRFPINQSLRNCLDLGGGLMAVRGYYASVRTSTLRVLVNVHTQTSAFYPQGTVWDLMKLHGFQDLRVLAAFLDKLCVKTTYMKGQDGKTAIEKVKTITRLSDLNARTQTFVNVGEEEVTVEEYFLQKYSIQLAHPEAPVLQIGTISRDQKGKTLLKKEQRPIWLPPELGSVMPGQICTQKLSPKQTTAMLGYAARPPAENARRLVDDGLRTLGLQSNNEDLSAFGVTVNTQMITVPARVLAPPLLQYKGTTQTTKAASWNMRGLTVARSPSAMLSPKTPSPWGVFQIACVAGKQRVDAFQKVLKSSGLGNHKPQFHVDLPLSKPADSAANDRSFEGKLTRAKKMGVKVILVVLPVSDPKLYGRLKFWADCKVGIHTVCCVHEKFEKEDLMTYANIALKFNAKLGGTNHHVRANQYGFLGKDTMIVGVDITHPSPNSVKEMPSIAGVVASIDENYSLWPGSIRLQAQYRPNPEQERTRPQEMVTAMETMFKERLDLYSRVNSGRLPKKILVYRDGVSESQYTAVLEKEYPKIAAACRSSYPPADLPSITIIVCGKRHHTRFYPTAEQHSDLTTTQGKWAKGNPKPGTVVDRGITIEQGFDFFLQAHAALQGTAKPAHYVIIKDDLKRTADEYQTITHNLCYHFARATKAVSYCPPAYYADLLCERGRFYLHKYFNAEPAEPGKPRETWDWNRSPWVQSSTPHPDLAGSMFYL